uniref:Uncharacterized protein n=1 Tax=Fagus sylvatica TaxID=28930 RepID=A0A2N9J509_FAGSY
MPSVPPLRDHAVAPSTTRPNHRLLHHETQAVNPPRDPRCQLLPREIQLCRSSSTARSTPSPPPPQDPRCRPLHRDPSCQLHRETHAVNSSPVRSMPTAAPPPRDSSSSLGEGVERQAAIGFLRREEGSNCRFFNR